MEFFSDLIHEGQAAWMSKNEYYLAIRKDGYDKAISEYSAEFQGLSKNELEERRHEHRSRRRAMAVQIDDLRLKFLSYYIICSITLDVWMPLLVLLVFGVIVGGYGLLVALFLFILDIVLFGLAAFIIRKIVEKTIESYQIFGFAEGMIFLSDYRKLESFDFSRLPDLESIIGEAPY